jgi:hypothetical protein
VQSEFEMHIGLLPLNAECAPPHGAVHVQGVGKKVIFSSSSRSFGYGYEAVRIRVKPLSLHEGYTNSNEKNKCCRQQVSLLSFLQTILVRREKIQYCFINMSNLDSCDSYSEYFGVMIWNSEF